MNSRNRNHSVEIWIEGSLKKYLESQQPIIVQPGRTIYQELSDLNIQFSQPLVALVNGSATDIHNKLYPGDIVKILPVISGG